MGVVRVCGQNATPLLAFTWLGGGGGEGKH